MGIKHLQQEYIHFNSQNHNRCEQPVNKAGLHLLMTIARNNNYGYFAILFFMLSESNSVVRLKRNFKNLTLNN
jgi:hypothetical protein